MSPLSPWPVALALAAVSIPLTFGLAALLVPRAAPFRGASLASWVAASLALLIGLGEARSSRGEGPTAGLPSVLVSLVGGVRLDVVTSVMLGLVTTLAVVIVRYSRTYLQGDPDQRRYARALLATLTAVTLLVVANHLLVLALAWSAASLALHELLTFYRDRSQARLAAHKKFLLSRLADVCMLGALALLGPAAGSLDLDVVHTWACSPGPLPMSAGVAAVLVVVAASLKSAQLPFHGWLTQVMEAPTPVSALLHAGVVNIGGFVLIRLAPLLTRVPVAQALLVVIGTTTAVVAALVMTTRVSVKVALAWSTCAQMGFLLLECGLGAWHLALLHLVAHSLYKAHAFLRSGSAVDRWRIQSLTAPAPPVPLGRVLIALGLVLAVMTAARWVASEVSKTPGASEAAVGPLTIVLALALAPLVARGLGRGWRVLGAVALRGLAVAALAGAWHTASGRLLGGAEAPLGSYRGAIIVAGFSLLFTVQVLRQARPGGRLARTLQPYLFAGLYLDEGFTRLTFWLWPPRLPAPRASSPSLPLSTSQEA